MSKSSHTHTHTTHAQLQQSQSIPHFAIYRANQREKKEEKKKEEAITDCLRCITKAKLDIVLQKSANSKKNAKSRKSSTFECVIECKTAFQKRFGSLLGTQRGVNDISMYYAAAGTAFKDEEDDIWKNFNVKDKKNRKYVLEARNVRDAYKQIVGNVFGSQKKAGIHKTLGIKDECGIEECSFEEYKSKLKRKRRTLVMPLTHAEIALEVLVERKRITLISSSDYLCNSKDKDGKIISAEYRLKANILKKFHDNVKTIEELQEDDVEEILIFGVFVHILDPDRKRSKQRLKLKPTWVNLRVGLEDDASIKRWWKFSTASLRYNPIRDRFRIHVPLQVIATSRRNVPKMQIHENEKEEGIAGTTEIFDDTLRTLIEKNMKNDELLDKMNLEKMKKQIDSLMERSSTTLTRKKTIKLLVASEYLKELLSWDDAKIKKNIKVVTNRIKSMTKSLSCPSNVKKKEMRKKNIDPEELVKCIEKIQKEDGNTHSFHKKKCLQRLKSHCLKHTSGVIASLNKTEGGKCSKSCDEIPFEKIQPLLPESLQTTKFSNLLRSFGSVKFFGDLAHAREASKQIKKSREKEGVNVMTSYAIAGDPNLRTFYTFLLPYLDVRVDVGTNVADNWIKRFQERGTDVQRSTIDKEKQNISQNEKTGSKDNNAESKKKIQNATKNWETYEYRLKRERKKMHTFTKELLLGHEIVILPTTQMHKVVKTPLNRKRCNVLCFGTFLADLRRQFASRPACVGHGITWVGEEHTSALCSQCCTYHGSLGASKTFVCPNEECKFRCDRDGNATWNIFYAGIAKIFGITSSSSKEKKKQKKKEENNKPNQNNKKSSIKKSENGKTSTGKRKRKKKKKDDDEEKKEENKSKDVKLHKEISGDDASGTSFSLSLFFIHFLSLSLSLSLFILNDFT